MTTDPPIRLLALFLVFFRIGIFSFGGGMTGWVYREVVQKRNWIKEEDFLADMTVCQILPGANIINLAVYVGQRLRGTLGALVTFFALLTAPFFVVIGLLTAYEKISGLAWVDAATDGVTAAAIGILMLPTWKSGLRLRRNLAGGLVMIATFVAVGVLRWPLIPVVLAITPVSIAAAWFGGKTDAE